MNKSLKISIVLVVFIIFGISCQTDNYRHIRTDRDTLQPKISLTVDTIINDNEASNESLRLIIDLFKERNSDMKITVNRIPASEYLKKLKVNFASDNSPDVFCWYPGYSLRRLIDHKMIADLTPVLENDPVFYNSFSRGMWKYVTFDEKIYGIPTGAAFVALFANTDILDKYGLSVPETYTELKYCVSVLSKNGVTPIAFNTTQDGLLLYYSIISMLSGNNYEDNSENTDKKYFIEAMDCLKELYALDAFPKNLFTLTNASRNQMFINKEAAFIVRRSDFISELYRNSTYRPAGIYDPADASVSISLFPRFETSKSNPNAAIYGASQNTLFVSKKASSENEVFNSCISLLKYITSDNNANLFPESSAPVNVIKNQESSALYYNPLLVSARTTFYSKMNQLILLPEMNKYYESIGFIPNNIQYIFNGIYDISDIIDEQKAEGISND